MTIIREILESHPAYGYRRVHALCNRRLQKLGEKPVNHKRVYRLMKQNGLLQKSRTEPKRKLLRKSLSASASNQRWCSDGFTLACENGEMLHVIFTLDCCDREIIAYSAGPAGYTARMVREVLLASLNKRFGQTHCGCDIELLTDNGSCYTAASILELSKAVGIRNHFIPQKSPWANGMAEAFVRTIRRDYASFVKLPDAATAQAFLARWIADYNQNAPHKALGMLSPGQYIKINKTAGLTP